MSIGKWLRAIIQGGWIYWIMQCIATAMGHTLMHWPVAEPTLCKNTNILIHATYWGLGKSILWNHIVKLRAFSSPELQIQRCNLESTIHRPNVVFMLVRIAQMKHFIKKAKEFRRTSFLYSLRRPTKLYHNESQASFSHVIFWRNNGAVLSTQQTRDVKPMLVQCWASVADSPRDCFYFQNDRLKTICYLSQKKIVLWKLFVNIEVLKIPLKITQITDCERSGSLADVTLAAALNI